MLVGLPVEIRFSSSVKLSTYIILYSEAQTLNSRNKKKNTFLRGGDFKIDYEIYSDDVID